MFFDLPNDFEFRMSSSSLDCPGGGGGFNMLNFMSTIMLSAQVRVVFACIFSVKLKKQNAKSFSLDANQYC